MVYRLTRTKRAHFCRACNKNIKVEDSAYYRKVDGGAAYYHLGCLEMKKDELSAGAGDVEPNDAARIRSRATSGELG